MGRISFKSDCDELGAYVHKRNMVCSRNLLQALTVNHGAAQDNAQEVDDLSEVAEPPPEPALPPLILIPTNKIDLIKRSVCRHFNVSRANIESSSRKRGVVQPRQICMYLARKHTDHSYPEIGRRLGGRDHTTIIHAFNKIEGLIAKDAAMAAVIADLEAIIT